LSRKIQEVRYVLYPKPSLIFTLYPPSSRLSDAELITPDSVLSKVLKLFVASFHLYHEKVKGPVPPGLTALSEPFRVPAGLQ
jgi:hypothetical protein